jgi:hypothetical protein
MRPEYDFSESKPNPYARKRAGLRKAPGLGSV